MRGGFKALACLAIASATLPLASALLAKNSHSEHLRTNQNAPLTGYWCFLRQNGTADAKNVWAISAARAQPQILEAGVFGDNQVGDFERRVNSIQMNGDQLIYEIGEWIDNHLDHNFKQVSKIKYTISLFKQNSIAIDREIHIFYNDSIKNNKEYARRCDKIDFNNAVAIGISSVPKRRADAEKLARYFAQSESMTRQLQKMNNDQEQFQDQMAQQDAYWKRKHQENQALYGAIASAIVGRPVTPPPSSSSYRSGSGGYSSRSGASGGNSGVGGYSASGGTSGSCKARQDALIERMTSAQSGGGGICVNERALLSVSQDMVNFYNQCPSADPSGQMRQSAQQNVKAAQEGIRQACVN